MLKKLSKAQWTSRKPWIMLGILLLLVPIGAVGCSKATSEQTTTQGQTTPGQKSSNPALKAAMEIRRLQSNQEMALTSDQKTKIKPILQELIDKTDPSKDFLQQKADAINAVFTDQQKTSLAGTSTQKNNSNGSSPDGNRPNANNGQGGAPKVGTNGSPPQPQSIYQEVLDSLK